MNIMNFKQINFCNNGIRLLIIVATIFIVWNNVQNVSLNTGGSLHRFNSYFCSPMLFVILISFGFLSANNTFSWKEYLKLILAIIILSLITSFMYLDFFFNFHKNSWLNKKSHQPDLKFDFINFWIFIFLQTEI